MDSSIVVVHLAVAGDVFDVVFLCCPFSPRDVLDEIWDLIESVSEDFPTYSSIFQSEPLHLSSYLALLHLEQPKFNGVWPVLSAIGLIIYIWNEYNLTNSTNPCEQPDVGVH